MNNKYEIVQTGRFKRFETCKKKEDMIFLCWA